MTTHSRLLPGKSQGRRSLVGCSPWGHDKLDTTERLHFHSSLSCTGEGNGNPLQCSCLENPRDGGAWWAAIYGVTQSQTRLKELSSSSSSSILVKNVQTIKKIKVANDFIISNNTREDSTHGHHQMVNTKIRLNIVFAAKDGKALYSQQKQDRELTVAQIMNSLLPNSDLN